MLHRAHHVFDRVFAQHDIDASELYFTTRYIPYLVVYSSQTADRREITQTQHHYHSSTEGCCRSHHRRRRLGRCRYAKKLIRNFSVMQLRCRWFNRRLADILMHWSVHENC